MTAVADVLVARHVGGLLVIGVGLIFGVLVLYGVARARISAVAKAIIVLAWALAIAAFSRSVW